jgi:hypothetical protein
MAPKKKYNTRQNAAEELAVIAKEEKEIKGAGGGRMVPKKYNTRQNAAEERAAIATVLEEKKGAGGGKRRRSMDPKLWGELQYHGDVLKNVYCRLPLEEFFKLRVVCKAWYCVARKRMALNEPIHRPFFTLCIPRDCITFGRDGILTYNKEETPLNNKFKSLPSAASRSRSSSETELSWVWTSHPRYRVVDFYLANEGLVCFHGPAVNCPYIVSVYDWNLPKHQRVRAVPEVPSGGSGPMVIGMGVFQKEQNERLRAFKLVLGSLECETQVFDSESDLVGWETKPCRPVVRGVFGPSTGCASCRGLVYITMEFSREILVYDFGNASWSSIDGPGGSAYSTVSMLPQHYRNDTLGEWKGHVLDVVDDRSSGSLSLWELVDETKEWRVFERMPAYLYSSWLMKSEDGTDRMADLTIHASFCGDYALVYSWDFQSRRAWRYCLFNMATKAWQELEVGDNTLVTKNVEQLLEETAGVLGKLRAMRTDAVRTASKLRMMNSCINALSCRVVNSIDALKARLG